MHRTKSAYLQYCTRHHIRIHKRPCFHRGRCAVTLACPHAAAPDREWLALSSSRDPELRTHTGSTPATFTACPPADADADADGTLPSAATLAALCALEAPTGAKVCGLLGKRCVRVVDWEGANQPCDKDAGSSRMTLCSSSGAQGLAIF